MLRSALLNVMIKAARKASRTLKRDFGELEHLQVSLKGPANFVTAADRRAEEIVREELEQARPGYTFVGEEGGVREGSDKTHRWIVDPIDGTMNFLHGIPHFAISIALEREGTIVAGLVYNPATDEMVTAERIEMAVLVAQQPDFAAVYLEIARALGGFRGIAPQWRSELLPRVAQHGKPTLLIWGDRDQILPAAHLAAARAAFPSAAWHLFPATGHMPQIERPDDFAQLVRPLLAEVRA